MCLLKFIQERCDKYPGICCGLAITVIIATVVYVSLVLTF